MFCYQRKYYSEVEVVNSYDQLKGILNDQWAATTIDAARAHLAEGNEKDYQACKRELPLFLFSCSEFTTSKNKKGAEGHWRTQATGVLNGLVVLDIDHIDEPRAVWERILSERPTVIQATDTQQQGSPWQVVMAYVTPSGKGLKIVFIADVDKGNIADNQQAFSEYIGVENDRAIKDSSRGSFVCKGDDVLYINPYLLISYNDESFDKKYGDDYRKNQSAPTKKEKKKKNETQNPEPSLSSGEDGNQTIVEPVNDEIYYGKTPISEIAQAYCQRYGTPVQGDRHRSLVKVAGHFRYLVDNNAQKLKVAIRTLPWVREWEREEGNTREIDDVIDDVCGYRMWREIPKSLLAVLPNQLRNADSGGQAVEDSAGESIVGADNESFFDRLRPLLEDDPLYTLCTSHLPEANRLAGVFVAGGMFCTLLTRCHYLHYDGRQHRMNPQVFIIGKPASGKSFADELDQAIMAVMRAADEPGRKAELDYKKEQKKRRTSNKAGKGEKQLEEPQACIRYIPSRTSNAVFYRRQINAKELIDGEIMPLHLYTFDSELDSSVAAQSGGSWIGKHDLELKAFHNEYSGVDYANSDSVNEVIQVFWNQIVTGTDVSLAKKINMRNVNDGLCSRIAICRIQSDDFAMIEKGNFAEHEKMMEALKQWGERFENLQGEIIIPKLVEHSYKLCKKAALAAQEKNDHVLDYLRKRAVFYAQWFTMPRIIARALLAKEKDAEVNPLKPALKQSDLDFAELMFDAIIYYQDVFFGKMLEDTWQNAKNEFVVRRLTRTSRNEELFDTLPQTFTRNDVMTRLSLNYNGANAQIRRWLSRGIIKRNNKNEWTKI